VEKKKKNFLKSKALKNTNQKQIIEESKVRPNLDLVTFDVLSREWRRGKDRSSSTQQLWRRHLKP
jgi:hypothetical protein